MTQPDNSTQVDARSVTYNIGGEQGEELLQGLSRVEKQLAHWQAGSGGDIDIVKPRKSKTTKVSSKGDHDGII